MSLNDLPKMATPAAARSLAFGISPSLLMILANASAGSSDWSSFSDRPMPLSASTVAFAPFPRFASSLKTAPLMLSRLVFVWAATNLNALRLSTLTPVF
jgi:hypothetical protein